MALLNRYNALPANLPNKEFALVKTDGGFKWYVGDENNLPVPSEDLSGEIPKEHQINGTRLTANITGTFNFDWNAYSQFVLTPEGTEAVVLGNENLPTGTNSKEIKGIIKVGTAVTAPANWIPTADSDDFDNTLDNHFRAWVSAEGVVTFTNKNKAAGSSVSGTDFTTLIYSEIIQWDLANSFFPKAKVDVTGNFALDKINLVSGANGFIKILKSTASDIILTLDSDFQHHEKKGQGVISSITLSGVSGTEFILEFVADGTAFYWDTIISGGSSEIANNSITYNKIQKVGALSLIGNSTSSLSDAQEVIMKPRVVGAVTGTWEDGISTMEGIDGQVSYDGTYLYFCNYTNKWFRVEKARLTNSYNIVSQVAINLKEHSKVTAKLALKVNYSLDYSAPVEGGEYLFALTQDTTARTVTFAAGKWQKGSGVTIPATFPTATSGAIDILSCRYISGKMVITNIASNVTDI